MFSAVSTPFAVHAETQIYELRRIHEEDKMGFTSTLLTFVVVVANSITPVLQFAN